MPNGNTLICNGEDGRIFEVTRDRKVVKAEWQGTAFQLMDTGGWMPGGTTLDEKVTRQSERAIEDADAVLFVVDATVGITERSTHLGKEPDTKLPAAIGGKAGQSRRQDSLELSPCIVELA